MFLKIKSKLKNLIQKLIKLITNKKFLIFSIISAMAGIIFVFSLNSYIKNSSQDLIFKEASQTPQKPVALVLGAQVWQDETLSHVFEDRCLTALELYQTGKIKKILISGDNSRKEYDEVTAAQKYLIEKGVPEEDIVLDYAGFDTYDSLYRAKHIFGVESLIVSTQEFHLPRALYIAKSLNLDAVGIQADKRPYLHIKNYKQREILANVKAFLNVIFKSEPKYLGEKEEIEIK
jgi:SanA protein